MTVAIVAVAMMVAVPSLTTFQRNAELTSSINSLLAAANSAKGEALKRGREAMVVPVDGTSWSSGWIVFVDMDRTRTFEAVTDVLIYKSEALPSYLTVSGTGPVSASSPYILFDSSGFPKTKANASGNLTLSIARSDASSSDLLNQTRRLKLSVSGRLRTCKPATDANCGATTTAGS